MKDDVKSKLELLHCYISDEQKIRTLTYIIEELVKEIEILKQEKEDE
jgi:hypothetical protein